MSRDGSTPRTASISDAIVAFGLALLPFAAQPFRVESFESHRAGLVGLLAILTFLFAWPRLRSLPANRRPLLFAIAAWALVLVLSTALSLSPTRSLFGELTRRMGLLTQLAMVAAVFIGLNAHASASGWAWLGGVSTAVLVLMEAAGIVWPQPLSGRPPGPFGSATLTGGWLGLMLVWSTASLLTGPIQRRWWAWTGLALMAAALVATGSRGALVGALVGLTTLAVFLTSSRAAPRRVVRMLLVLLVIVAGGAGIRVSTFEFGRFFDGSAFAFRNAMWRRTRDLTLTWPVMTAIDGSADRWAVLRPLVGYGPEMLEPVFYQRLDMTIGAFAPNQRIDRAHNDWLDVLTTSGRLGALVRLALWLAIVWTALRRLGLRGSVGWLLVPLGVGLVFGYQAGRFAPLAASLGGVVGVWLLLTFARDEGHTPDMRALIALSVALAHLVDLQFSFTTVATGWPFWLAVGLLLTPSIDRESDTGSAIPLWKWLALAGMWLLRFWVGSGAASVAVVLACAVFVVLADRFGGVEIRRAPLILLAWLFGFVGSQMSTPLLASGWDMLAFVVSGALLVNARLNTSLADMRYRTTSLLITAAVLLFWASDIAADVAFRVSRTSDDLSIRRDAAEYAAQRRPWDDQLLQSVGYARYQLALTSSAGVLDADLLNEARDALLQAAALQPYSGGYALQLAAIEANRALRADDPAPLILAANGYFEGATHLWPLEPAVWREWGRFALEIKGDAAQAETLLTRALSLDEGNLEARTLMERATATSQ